MTTPHPWSELNIPEGFTLGSLGVYMTTSKGDHRVAGPVWVDAYTRDNQNGSWGLSVCWVDPDGLTHSRAIPKPRLHESSTVLAQELASDGLDIVPGKERELNRYLAAFEPMTRLRSVSKLGWVDNDGGELIFVLPNQVIARNPRDTIIYQPEHANPSTHTIVSKGSLEAWRYEVAMRCAGNPLLVFSVCTAFAAPLLEPAHLDGGGFHIYGASSQGKTTALQVAVSVWGCGADPAEAAGQTAIRRWNATKNGLEGLTASHNDILLAMDELGSLDAEDFGRVIYNIAGGQGKSAMNANRTLKEQYTWRNLILSTGEISGQQKIQESRRQIKAGQQLRFMDIPITEGVIIDTHRMDPAEFANRLKRTCSEHYGTAGPAFVEKLIAFYSSERELQRDITGRVDTESMHLTQGISLPEHRRAIRKLGLVLVAGRLAQQYGILPESLDIRLAVETVRDRWLGDAGNLPETTLGVRAVQNFILRRRDSFRDAFATGIMGGRDISGYYNTQHDLYLFTDEGFSEACGGYNSPTVAGELATRGLLHMNDNRYKSKQMVKLDGTNRRIRLFAVKGRILDTDLE